MVRKRRHHQSRWQAVRRLEAVLGSLRGRARDHFDRRDPERGPRPRLLDLNHHGKLFDRLAALDYEYLMSLDFAASTEILRLLLPQSVLGRAQNGHGFWRDETGSPLAFRDATFDRVLAALQQHDPNLKASRVRQERNLRLQILEDWLVSNMFERELRLDSDHGPLLGVDLLADQSVQPREFLRGMLMAAWMDDLSRRRACMAMHRRTFAGNPLEISGGQTFVVRPDLLAAVGIVDPGRGEFMPEDIDRLIDLGVISIEDRTYERPEFEQAYFRQRAGEGVCDDLALIWVGACHGWDAFLGAFIMDGVDTYDKYLWSFRPGGFDGCLAVRLQSRWRERYGEPLVSDKEILEVIRFAAKLNHPACLLSSSHRRLIQTEEGSRVPTLLNHWRFIQGDPVFEIELGYNRFPSKKFYDIASNRLNLLQKDVPEARFVPRHKP